MLHFAKNNSGRLEFDALTSKHQSLEKCDRVVPREMSHQTYNSWFKAPNTHPLAAAAALCDSAHNCRDISCGSSQLRGIIPLFSVLRNGRRLSNCILKVAKLVLLPGFREVERSRADPAAYCSDALTAKIGWCILHGPLSSQSARVIRIGEVILPQVLWF